MSTGTSEPDQAAPAPAGQEQEQDEEARKGGVTQEHEARHKVVAFDPALYSAAIRHATRIELPVPQQIEELSVDLTEIRPLERRSDSVLLARFAGRGRPRLIVVVESQTDKDPGRRRRWPYYVAFLHDKYGCPVLLLVLCSSAATAAWAREPIITGPPGAPAQVTTAIVLGPDNFPPITTVAEAARNVPLAVLGALIHSRSRGRAATAILESLAGALSGVDTAAASDLAEFTELGPGKTAAGSKWRAMMATRTYPFLTEQRRLSEAKGEKRGEAKGEAKALLRILRNRGISVDGPSRDQILACTDTAMLESWLDRSLTVTSVTELLAAAP